VKLLVDHKIETEGDRMAHYKERKPPKIWGRKPKPPKGKPLPPTKRIPPKKIKPPKKKERRYYCLSTIHTKRILPNTVMITTRLKL
jgi:hypothetical protein